MKTWKHKVMHPEYGVCSVKEATDRDCERSPKGVHLAPASHGFVNFYDHSGTWVGWAGCHWAQERIIRKAVKLNEPKRLSQKLLHDSEGEGVMKNIRAIEDNTKAVEQVLSATATYVAALEGTLNWIMKETTSAAIKNEIKAVLKKGKW